MDERIEITGVEPQGGLGGLNVEKMAGGSPEQKAPQENIEQKNEKVGELMERISTHSGNLQATSPTAIQADALGLSGIDEEDRITQLLALADTKGVVHAVSVARTLEDFYALDLLRDTLIERFHEKLDQEIG